MPLLAHKVFSPLKRFLPAPVAGYLRKLGTSLATPVAFSLRSGHFRSTWAGRPVTDDGDPLPWYTYPCIDFLGERSFSECNILEFGGGQSTLWWARRASTVVTLEGDVRWHDTLKTLIPDNVSLYNVAAESRDACIASVKRVLAEVPDRTFDIIVIDGLYRAAMIDTAMGVLADNGAIIGDTSENPDLFNGLRDQGMSRVDFYGYVPGNMMRSCMSIYFRRDSPLFDARVSISSTLTAEHRTIQSL